MTSTQHAHIYSFHNSNFNFGGFFLFFYQYSPLWSQPIKVFTDHKNLMRDVLGLISNQVYQWRLLLEEYGPKIVLIKSI
jgi:hypothetical protein